MIVPHNSAECIGPKPQRIYISLWLYKFSDIIMHMTLSITHNAIQAHINMTYLNKKRKKQNKKQNKAFQVALGSINDMVFCFASSHFVFTVLNKVFH